MASEKDIVVEARELLNKPTTAVHFRDAGEPLLRALADEVEALRRGEFICSRCHHRKDAETERPDF